MADFEAPSFSLGLDCDLFDSEPQISSVSEDDDYETLLVDDSEPEYSDPHPHPKLKRLRRVLTANVTTTSSSSNISANPKVELNSSPIVNDEDDYVFCLQKDRLTDEHLHTQTPALSTSSKLPNTSEALTNQPAEKSQTGGGPRRRFLLTVSDISDSDSDDAPVNHRVNNSKCNVSESIGIFTAESLRSEKSSLDFDDSLPPAFRYFFHDDQRIRELVQSRLPNFSPLRNVPNRDLEQPSTSEIDYMGQFSSSIQAGRNFKDDKSSTRSKISRKEKIEEISQGWVNPKLCVDKGMKKGDMRRNGHAIPKTAGYWLTGPDGKRVYVGKKGQELTGRVAYMQYKKESGTGFKKAKRKSATKKKK